MDEKVVQEEEREPLVFHYRNSMRITGDIDYMLDSLLNNYDYLRGIFNPLAEEDPGINPDLISGLNDPFEIYTKIRAGESTDTGVMVASGYAWHATRTKDDEFIVHNYIHSSIDGGDLREMENEGNEYRPHAERVGCRIKVYQDDSAEKTITTSYGILKIGRSEWRGE